jgi:hypothetical protein
MLAMFALGYLFGIGTLAASSSIRRALTSRQQRDQAFEQRAERIGLVGHE